MLINRGKGICATVLAIGASGVGVGIAVLGPASASGDWKHGASAAHVSSGQTHAPVTAGNSASAHATSGAAQPGSASAHATSGAAPGGSGSAPVHSVASGLHSAPGHSGDAPGHSGGAPGNSGNAPGHSGDAPGHSGSAPGHSGSSQGPAGPPSSPPTQPPSSNHTPSPQVSHGPPSFSNAGGQGNGQGRGNGGTPPGLLTHNSQGSQGGHGIGIGQGSGSVHSLQTGCVAGSCHLSAQAATAGQTPPATPSISIPTNNIQAGLPTTPIVPPSSGTGPSIVPTGSGSGNGSASHSSPLGGGARNLVSTLTTPRATAGATTAGIVTTSLGPGLAPVPSVTLAGTGAATLLGAIAPTAGTAGTASTATSPAGSTSRPAPGVRGLTSPRDPNVIQRIERVVPGFVWIALAAALALAAVGGAATFLAGRRVRRQAGQFAAVTAAAMTDPLTGVLNRRGFIEALERELARARRYGLMFTLAYVDVRGLKRVNDTAGHLAGDELLKEAARLLKDSARADDVVGRIGGDEMGLLLVEQGPEGAETVMRRITSQIPQRRAALGIHSPWDLTVGIASFPADGSTVNELLATADRRLYEQRGIALR